MVELFEEDGVRGARRYLDHLKMEYAFWMDGAESLALNPGLSPRCADAGRFPLNRYWDGDRDTPRGDHGWKMSETAKTLRSSAQ